MAKNLDADAALVLVGHGSLVHAESSAPIYQQADELRRRGLFAQVLECFWKLEPGIGGVLRGVFTPSVFIVPMFISDGYFTEEVIPRELGFCAKGQTAYARVQQRGFQTLHYGRPIGTHASMAEVILGRAREIVVKHPFPRPPKPKETTLFLAGHGTGRNENSRQAIEDQVGRLRALNLFADVHGLFLEEEPRVGNCYELSRTRNLVVVPYFISDGMHSYEDIPILLGEPKRVVEGRLKAGQPTWRNPTEKKGKLVWYTASVGSEPMVAEVILERVREMRDWTCS